MLDAEYPQARGVRLRCVSAPTGPQTTSMCSVSCRGIYHKMRSELWWTFVTHPGDSPLLNPFLSLRLKSYTYLVPGCAPSAGGNGETQASAGRARWAGAYPLGSGRAWGLPPCRARPGTHAQPLLRMLTSILYSRPCPDLAADVATGRVLDWCQI